MATRPVKIKQTGAKGRRRRGSVWKDPITRTLILAIGIVVVAGLMTAAGMILWGVVPLNLSPSSIDTARVNAEQELVKTNPDAENWGALIVALGHSGRMAEAQQQLAAAQKAKLDVTRNQSILYAEAQLYIMQKKYSEALPVLEQVKSKLYDAYVAELKSGKTDQNWAVAYGMPENHYAATLDIARIYQTQGKNKEALDMLNYYLKGNPTEAGVIIGRGDLKYQMGDFKGAVADYQQALKFLPDSKEAQDGLKKAKAKQ